MIATCAECAPSTEWLGVWDVERCVAGVVYGFCPSELCGGVCEDQGSCDCRCHRRANA